VLDRSTDTLYVPEFIDGDVAALDARTCNASRRAGCRHEASTITMPDVVLSLGSDPATHTLYAGGLGFVALVDTRACRAGHLTGCHATPVEVPLGTELRDIIVDQATHTVYLADRSGGVIVLDASSCSVARQPGCAPVATIAPEAHPGALALNPRTHTVYAANGVDATVSLIDAAHCNALNQTGCATAPPTVSVDGPSEIAVDPGTNTAYVSLSGDTVAVLHGAEPVATIPVGPDPIGVALDRVTHTLYVANAADDLPGTVSAVDTRHCNGLDTGRCDQNWPTTPAGRVPWAIAVDPRTHTVFTTNLRDATVSVIQGASCNATNHTGCARTAPRVPIGDLPFNLTLDRASHTLYTANALNQSVSVIDTRAPCHARVRCEF
jgi:DNA-binding beta-propeller fold protein YncE